MNLLLVFVEKRLKNIAIPKLHRAWHRVSPPASEISAAEARRRNGLLWNNPGDPPEPRVMWTTPNGAWGAPDWRNDLPQRMRKAYLFHAEGANVLVDVENGSVL